MAQKKAQRTKIKSDRMLSLTKCVVCGATYTPDHHCDRIREPVAYEPGVQYHTPYGNRLDDGFAMMDDDE